MGFTERFANYRVERAACFSHVNNFIVNIYNLPRGVLRRPYKYGQLRRRRAQRSNMHIQRRVRVWTRSLEFNHFFRRVYALPNSVRGTKRTRFCHRRPCIIVSFIVLANGPGRTENENAISTRPSSRIGRGARDNRQCRELSNDFNRVQNNINYYYYYILLFACSATASGPSPEYKRPCAVGAPARVRAKPLCTLAAANCFRKKSIQLITYDIK